MSSEYHFTIALNLYDDCPIERQREIFRAALFDELVKARRELSYKLRMLDWTARTYGDDKHSERWPWSA